MKACWKLNNAQDPAMIPFLYFFSFFWSLSMTLFSVVPNYWWFLLLLTFKNPKAQKQFSHLLELQELFISSSYKKSRYYLRVATFCFTVQLSCVKESVLRVQVGLEEAIGALPELNQSYFVFIILQYHPCNHHVSWEWFFKDLKRHSNPWRRIWDILQGLS